MPSPLEDLLARTSPWVAVLALALLLAVGFHLGIRAGRWVLRHRAGRTRRLGRRGERRALALLEAEGWRIEAREVTAPGTVVVDGVLHRYEVRADAIVRRGGVRYVAEFKGGAPSASPTNRDTRRQLLEYALLFDVEGVLLVDGAARRIHHVSFPRAG